MNAWLVVMAVGTRSRRTVVKARDDMHARSVAVLYWQLHGDAVGEIEFTRELPETSVYAKGAVELEV